MSFKSSPEKAAGDYARGSEALRDITVKIEKQRENREKNQQETLGRINEYQHTMNWVLDDSRASLVSYIVTTNIFRDCSNVIKDFDGGDNPVALELMRCTRKVTRIEKAQRNLLLGDSHCTMQEIQRARDVQCNKIKDLYNILFAQSVSKEYEEYKAYYERITQVVQVQSPEVIELQRELQMFKQQLPVQQAIQGQGP